MRLIRETLATLTWVAERRPVDETIHGAEPQELLTASVETAPVER